MYDDTGNRVCYDYYSQGSCNFTANAPLNGSRTYTAYVAYGVTPPNPGPPTNDVRAVSSAVTIRHEGWMGGLSIDATSSNGQVAVVATASSILPSPYQVSLYRGTQRLAVCQWGHNACTVTVAPDPNNVQVVSAYVAQDAPTTAKPGNDVRATASVGLLGSTPVENIQEDIELFHIAQLAGELAARGLDPCERLLFVPGTHTQGTSTTDAYNDCIAATGAWIDRVKLLAARYGPMTAVALSGLIINRDTGQEVTDPVDPNNPDPSNNVEVPPNQSDVDRLAQYLIDHSWNKNKTTQKLTDLASAKTIARECIQRAIHVSPAMGNPCEDNPIFVPANDVRSATENDIEALKLHPTWVQLHNVTTAAKGNLQRAHEAAGAECKPWPNQYSPPSGNTQCDEYPYFASYEGGAKKLDPGTGTMVTQDPYPYLRQADEVQNQREGNRYSTFKKSGCPLSEPSDTQRLGPDGTAFLVLPTLEVAETTWTCGPEGSNP